MMREFVASSSSLTFTGADRKEIYGLVERTLQAHEYLRLAKKNKGVVRRYLAKISGRSLAQVTALNSLTEMSSSWWMSATGLSGALPISSSTGRRQGRRGPETHRHIPVPDPRPR